MKECTRTVVQGVCGFGQIALLLCLCVALDPCTCERVQDKVHDLNSVV